MKLFWNPACEITGRSTVVQSSRPWEEAMGSKWRGLALKGCTFFVHEPQTRKWRSALRRVWLQVLRGLRTG